MVVKTLDSWAQIWLSHLLAEWPRTSHPGFLCLSLLLISEIEMIIPTSQDCGKLYIAKHLQIEPGTQ